MADEAVCIGPAPAAAELPATPTRILEAARAHRRRRRSIPATASCPRTPASPRPARPRASPSSARRRSRCAPSASSTRRARWPRRTACRCCRAPACWPTPAHALAEAARIGYPVMLKSTAGGGGIGMRAVPRRRRARRGRSTSVQRLARSQLQRRRRLPREVRRARAPHRGADLRRRRGQRARARRARLLGAAPQPEGDRGNPRAGPARAQCARRCCAAAVRLARAVQLPLGRHRRVRLRRAHAASSTSSRSTRGCRSSTASPRR